MADSPDPESLLLLSIPLLVPLLFIPGGAWKLELVPPIATPPAMTKRLAPAVKSPKRAISDDRAVANLTVKVREAKSGGGGLSSPPPP